MCRAIVLLLTLLFCHTALAFELDDKASGAWLNDHLELLQERDGPLSLAAVQASRDFIPANGRTSVGQSPDGWWLRLDLDRRTAPLGGWWLEVDAVNLRTCASTYPTNGASTGKRCPARPCRSPRAVTATTADRSSTCRRHRPVRIYARVYDPAGNSFPLRIWSLDDLQDHRADTSLFLGFIYGLIAALLLYNLFILLTLRDPAYFWYVLTTASALLFSLGMSGHGFEYFWPDHPVPGGSTASPCPRSGAFAYTALPSPCCRPAATCAGRTGC